ncbi:unnamed protein product [Arctia plantaginis]|uniref:Zinc finger CCCH-type with G patch domain-containing protein n=1 Tax=Arctia plantaginis TaxID=874455 RepID=A0A8S1A281_ARCPL|nr:unnamed protein product [Arctia plantaginis]
MDELQKSLNEYEQQLCMVNSTLETVDDENERESILSLQSDLQQLIELTKENLEALLPKESTSSSETQSKDELADEYALFQAEMAKSGAYEEKNEGDADTNSDDKDRDIEDDLSTLLGMKCSVYHTHKWGGQPSLYNAMVSAIVPMQENVEFNDLQVRVLFTHPTHAEMLPCPFFLDGECKFSDEQCRYSHGAIVQLSDLKEAIEPDFSALKVGSRILMKMNPPQDEDISVTKKSTEKYHLWHRAVIKSLDPEKKVCLVKLEHGVTGQKRKLGSGECTVQIEDIYPLDNTEDVDSDTNDSLSDTEYPSAKTKCEETAHDNQSLLIEKSLQNPNNTPIGEWERHTRGIGSRLMLAMGYVPGTGLGAASDGRVKPVEARVLPVGKSLDHCMAISEKNAAQDPLKVEQRLKRTLGNKAEEVPEADTSVNVKQSTSKDLNIEQFKISEDKKRIEREITKLNSSLIKYPAGSNGHKSINLQIIEKNKELTGLTQKEKQISKEQAQRKDKQKMTVF